MIVCQACKEVIYSKSPNDLIREGYWPGAAERRSRYIFDQQLFQFYDLLQKNNPGLSEYGFLQTLRKFSEMKGRVNYICAHCSASHGYIYRKVSLMLLHLARHLMNGDIASMH